MTLWRSVSTYALSILEKILWGGKVDGYRQIGIASKNVSMRENQGLGHTYITAICLLLPSLLHSSFTDIEITY